MKDSEEKWQLSATYDSTLDFYVFRVIIGTTGKFLLGFDY